VDVVEQAVEDVAADNMYGLGPLPYRPNQGQTEDLYNQSWKNQKPIILEALKSGMRFDRLGKRGASTPYYTGAAYIYFMTNFAKMIRERIDFLVTRDGIVNLESIKAQYNIECIIDSLPCISNCKGVNLRKSFLQILEDFGIGILTTNEVIGVCPGVGSMVIGSNETDAFVIGDVGCGEDGEYDSDEYDNDEYN
jgi:hypothetical protein